MTADGEVSAFRLFGDAAVPTAGQRTSKSTLECVKHWTG